MRFIVDDEREVDLCLLESALRQFDAAYSIDRDDPDDSEGLLFAGDTYAQIEVNRGSGYSRTGEVCCKPVAKVTTTFQD